MVREKGGKDNMKKIFRLFALPLFLLLTSCSSINLQSKANVIKEDTNIHNELFNEDNSVSYDLGIRQPRKLASDLVEPPIGMQFLNYPEETKNKYAVRFVAAIKSLDVTATWTRAVSDKYGTQSKTLTHDIEVTKAYRTLNNGGLISTCSEQYPGYEYYVVYTMYDIPSSHEDSYIMAYLTLSYGEETPVKSKAVVAQIKGDENGGHVFSFDIDSVTNNYFMAIDHESGPDTIWYGEAGAENLEHPELEDHAVFDNASMEFISNDTFGLFKLTSSEFVFCNYSTYLGSTASRFSKTAGTRDNYGQLYLPGKYSIYINYLEKGYIVPTDVETTISFVPNSDWLSNHYDVAPRFALYAFGGSAGEEWFDLTKKGAQNLYRIENFNIGTHTTVIFCRMDGRDGHSANNWSNKVNQTHNIVIDSGDGPATINLGKYNLSNDKSGGDTWDDFTGSWSA